MVVKLQKVPYRERYCSYKITLPKKLVEMLGWKPGDNLVVELKEVEGKKGLFIYRV